MNKDEKRELKNTLRELALLEMAADLGAEEVKMKINEVILQYHMKPHMVLAMLARLTAGFIQVMKKNLPPEQSDVLEGKYHEMLEIYLADMDLVAIQKEIEKIKNEKAN